MVHRPHLPIYVFSHHKCGTVLLTNIFQEVADRLNMSIGRAYGFVEDPPKTDITIFEHSLVSKRVFQRPFKGVHVRRDPREIVVSGYLYHMRTNEKWCLTKPEPDAANLMYPLIPYEREHASTEWKIQYLNRLNGRSYQQNLLERDQKTGLRFEMQRVAGWAITDLLEWNYGNPNIFETSLERLSDNFDQEVKDILLNLGFSRQLAEICRMRASKHNLNEMTESSINENEHITGLGKKWPAFFDREVLADFHSHFGDAPARLGYPPAGEFWKKSESPVCPL